MRRSTTLILVAAGVLAVVAFFTGCANKSSTAPPGGGGGGGGISAVINSGNLANGGSFTFTFPDTGTTGYHCGIHPTTMRGNSVTVTSTATLDSILVTIVGLSTPGFSPSAVSIKPGGKVRWVNADGLVHTVESD